MHAMVDLRHWLGLADRPRCSTSATSDVTWSAAMSRMTSFWYGVVRTRVDPCASTVSTSLVNVGPETRPAVGATPM